MEIKKGQAMVYDWFGGKVVMTGADIETAKKDDNVRKIYFNNGKKIIRIK